MFISLIQFSSNVPIRVGIHNATPFITCIHVNIITQQTRITRVRRQFHALFFNFEFKIAEFRLIRSFLADYAKKPRIAAELFSIQ